MTKLGGALHCSPRINRLETTIAGLKLVPGGKLVRSRWVYDEAVGQGSYVQSDVTDQASAFLFSAVELDGGLILEDLFRLLAADKNLVSVLAREWSEAYLAEAFAKPSKPYAGEYDPDEFEYLELYQMWKKDSATGELDGVGHLDFHGVGFELREDVREGASVIYRKGSRIQWSLSFQPLDALLSLPLRYDPVVRISESNHDDARYGQIIETLKVNYPTLGQVLHGVLWEISFYGGPKETQQAAQQLQDARAAIPTGAPHGQ